MELLELRMSNGLLTATTIFAFRRFIFLKISFDFTELTKTAQRDAGYPDAGVIAEHC